MIRKIKTARRIYVATRKQIAAARRNIKKAQAKNRKKKRR